MHLHRYWAKVKKGKEFGIQGLTYLLLLRVYGAIHLNNYSSIKGCIGRLEGGGGGGVIQMLLKKL